MAKTVKHRPSLLQTFSLFQVTEMWSSTGIKVCARNQKTLETHLENQFALESRAFTVTTKFFITPDIFDRK